MAQNIYDDDGFFSGYSGLARSVKGLEGAGEWPSIRGMLPDVAGLRVVDLGCGFGWFCRWAREAGAAEVLGLDLSEKMLERARRETDDPAVAYGRADLDRSGVAGGWVRPCVFFAGFALPGKFGAGDGGGACGAGAGGVVRVLGGAPDLHGAVAAWVRRCGDGRRVWPLDGYLKEGARVTNWFAPGVVKHHRTVGTYVTALLDAGFSLAALQEWGPSDAQIAEHPAWAVERERPPFLLVAARRA